MAEKLPNTALSNQSIRDLSGGMVSYAYGVMLPDNVCYRSVNLNFDKVGGAQTRLGTTVLGTVVSTGDACHGLGQLFSASGSTNFLVSAFNGVNYAWNGSTWSGIGGGMTTARVRYATFVDYLFRVGGGAAPASWNGSGSFSSSELGGVPTSTAKFLEVYKSRLYLAGDTNYPDRLYYSDVVSSTNHLSWTATNYVDINPDDNGNITAIKKMGTLLYILKDNGTYRWNGTSTDPDKIFEVGTTSQESVQTTQGIMFFFNPDGIFATDGSAPVRISKPVTDWIKGMSSSFYGYVNAVCDNDHYYCNIGNVTLSDRSFSNVWLVYTVSSKAWAVYSFGGLFYQLAQFKDSFGGYSLVGGDSAGYVQTIFSGTTDNGSAIAFEYNKEFEFGSRGATKEAHEIIMYVENGVGTQVFVQPDDKAPVFAGEVTDKVSMLGGFSARGNALTIKIRGNVNGDQVNLMGYEWNGVNNLGFISPMP